jgi:chromosome segregation ATPase
MKVMPRCLLVLASACALADGAQSGVTPVQKVLGLLGGMVEKGKTEKHEEQVQFATYKQFCEDTTTEKKRAIAEANERIEELKANIGKYAADAARLKREIGQHDADIATWKGDETAATKVRNIERADYDKLHQDYSESVDALQRAIQVLRSWGSDRRQGSLMQISALKDLRLMPKEATTAIDAFLQDTEEPTEGLAVSAPEAYAYEFQSHGIIEMLQKLLDKFMDERTALEKKEMNAKHAYDLLEQDLKAQIEQRNFRSKYCTQA